LWCITVLVLSNRERGNMEDLSNLPMVIVSGDNVARYIQNTLIEGGIPEENLRCTSYISVEHMLNFIKQTNCKVCIFNLGGSAIGALTVTEALEEANANVFTIFLTDSSAIEEIKERVQGKNCRVLSLRSVLGATHFIWQFESALREGMQ